MVYIYITHHLLCAGPGPSEACMGWGCTERSHEHGIIAMSKNRDETLQIGICRYNLNIKWMDPCLGMWLNKTSTFQFYNVFFSFTLNDLWNSNHSNAQSLTPSSAHQIWTSKMLNLETTPLGVSCEKSFFHLSIADRCLSSRGSVASGLKARTIDSNDIGAAFIPIYQFVYLNSVLLIVRLFFASTKLNRLNPNYMNLSNVYIIIHQFVK